MKARRLLSLLVPFATWFGVQSCADNQPAYEGILGRSVRDELEVPGTSGAGGAGGEAGSPAASEGGAPPVGPGGGKSGMGEGGEVSRGGSDSEAGNGTTTGTGAHPPVDPDFSPACFLTPTQSGEEILKGTPCTSEDPKLCYRPCGPDQVGWKTETCLAGVYAEGDCTFPPAKDYSCYAIPSEIDEGACGVTAAPAATDECDAPLCMPCNLSGFYQDTGSDVKEGYCVCREPDEGGVRRWTCASTTAWPCPFNRGC